VHVLITLEVPLGVVRDLGEPAFCLGKLLVGQQTGGVKSLRVLGGRLAVIGEQLGVVDAEKLPDGSIEAALDAARPQ
jgi:hypothetical protein